MFTPEEIADIDEQNRALEDNYLEYLHQCGSEQEIMSYQLQDVKGRELIRILNRELRRVSLTHETGREKA